MSVVHNKGGFAMPFLLRDIRSQAITAAFAPTTQEYIKHGFLVMPAADLTLEVITWDRYNANGKTTVGLTAVSVFCSAGQWLPCPIVYVGAEAGVTVNIGVI
jgi:hypothetical protein